MLEVDNLLEISDDGAPPPRKPNTKLANEDDESRRIFEQIMSSPGEC